MMPNDDEVPGTLKGLPDPLIFSNGASVQTASDWMARRAELLSLFEEHVYGRAPQMPSIGEPVLVSLENNAMGGLATRKVWRVPFTAQPDSPGMDLLVYLPNTESGPVPVFLGLNFGGNQTVHSDPDIPLPQAANPEEAEARRGADASSWPLELIIGRGYGVATVYYGDLDPDFDDGFHNGVHALEPAAYSRDRSANAWGAIGAWAWGLSRALDTLVQDSEVAGDQVAVIGHSRLGKTALWAGTQDTRFAMVISNNSGCGGASLARHQAGESISQITTMFPHWFCRNYSEYAGREDDLPVDQHELIALAAPRPVYVASAVEDQWADPEGEFLAARAASPVYRLLGTEGLRADEMPELNQPVDSIIGYHIRSGGHGITTQDWGYYLDFADRYL